MKASVISLILFSTLIFTIVANAIFIRNTRQYIIDSAEDIKNANLRGERIQELELFWKHRRKMAGLSVSDVILDQTSNNIICIKCAYEEGNEAELRRYCLLLTDSANCIGRNEKISIDNIF